MQPTDNDKWAKAHFEHDLDVEPRVNVASKRSPFDVRINPVVRQNPNRELYNYDHGASDVHISRSNQHSGIRIERNGRAICTFYGSDAEIEAALMVQASAMRNMLIDVLNGSVTHAQIHALLQRATLKR